MSIDETHAVFLKNASFKLLNILKLVVVGAEGGCAAS